MIEEGRLLVEDKMETNEEIWFAEQCDRNINGRKYARINWRG